MEVSGKAQVTLGQTVYTFDIASIKLGVGYDDEPGEVMFSGGKVYSAGSQSTSFTVPIENVTPDLLSLITGERMEPVIQGAGDINRERLKRHPDGSESWIETVTLPSGIKRMRTCYASEWSDYMKERSD